jgi:hypothetical protein
MGERLHASRRGRHFREIDRNRRKKILYGKIENTVVPVVSCHADHIHWGVLIPNAERPELCTVQSGESSRKESARGNLRNGDLSSSDEIEPMAIMRIAAFHLGTRRRWSWGDQKNSGEFKWSKF